ncbi:MAG TPA: hypothetical protein VJH75_02900 [Patescibacteria group bacterium]|nr:hypothetical protein [Patescibacteria group bacterium]
MRKTIGILLLATIASTWIFTLWLTLMVAGGGGADIAKNKLVIGVQMVLGLLYMILGVWAGILLVIKKGTPKNTNEDTETKLN